MRASFVTLFVVGALLPAACGGDDDTDVRSSEPTITTASTIAPSETTRRFEYQPGVYLSFVGPVESGACPEGLKPAMVTITQSQEYAYAFARRGYLGVIVDARYPGYEATFDARLVRAIGSVVHDTAIAVQWLRAHADDYCIEPNAIAATGHSFGALAALALGYSEGEGPVGPITIDEYGETVTVPPVDWGPVPPELAAYSNDLDGIVSFSGFALPDHIDSGEPPVIMFHGRDDSLIPFALAEQTCAAARAVGVTCELVSHESGHAPAADLSAALDQAEAFLDREMLAPAGLVATAEGTQP